MILNGKAKEDCIEWIKWNYNYLEYKFDLFDKTYRNALTIEWLDSVGIYLTILPCIDKTFDSYLTIDEKRIEVSQFNINRKKATEKAIEKANEIYNSL